MAVLQDIFCFFFLFKDFIYLFLEWGEGRERNINVWMPPMSPNGDLARNLGMSPDWELNGQPFGLQSKLNPLSYNRQGGHSFLWLTFR